MPGLVGLHEPTEGAEERPVSHVVRSECGLLHHAQRDHPDGRDDNSCAAT